MKTKLIFAAMAAFAFLGTFSYASAPTRDADNQTVSEHKIGIVPHRGYWNCEASGYSQNSIASLRTAQEYGFWGSEMDVHMTTDEVLLVFHDDRIGDLRLDGNPYSEFADYTLKNGEKIPTFDEYLDRVAVNPKLKLVCEFKTHPTPEQEDRLVELCISKIKEHGLYDPDRIIFISFSRHICEILARTMPEFTNQYLNGDEAPDQVYASGINGIDYHYDVLRANPEWVEQAHKNGMSVNAWTANKREDIEEMVKLGVDFITSDNPELVRTILAEMGVKEL